ncbi:integrase arm-type DNA-binding domain-containing protein [Methylorubrum extorquens]|uniref:Integrase DNA-binding domain-containing protein n=1 Tax=Methylorubrum extorquens (strain CM4 / NCIMB 13688) TaxID=440085 RepID=B7KW12_METC4|nr:integrase arm-type DNA-binding domain-containing protein [Methylorubrum extorquens]ACK82828.1 conserved hypothetical protein [Methylorubrum extorquens CM4]
MAKAKKSRGTYLRERVRLTADHTKKAAALIAAGKVEGRGLEFADAGCPGLILRVTPLSAAWLLKTEKATVRLGDMDALPVAAAREAALRSRLALKDGRHPGEDLAIYQQALQHTDDVATAADAAFPDEVHTPSDAHRRKHGPWTWEDLVDEFLAAQLPKKKASWAPQFERHLRYRGFEAIRFMPLCKLDVETLERVRDAIADEVAISSVARAVNQTKAALDWAWRYKRRQSRLGAVAWWESFDIEYVSGTRDHVPTLAELGRTLALAERHRVLGTTRQETTPGTIAALWATVLTAQRTGPLGGTRLDRIIPMPDRPGWQVWTWSADDMKGGKAPRPHALPIPPAAIDVLARFEDPDTDSPYLFPSRMDRRHVTSEGIAGLLDRLQGKSKPSRKPGPGKATRAPTPRTNLFERHGIRPWVPHDARRALGSFLDDEDLGGAASAILAHKTGKKDPEHARLEDVTRKVYAKAQRLDLKARGMEAWVPAVIAAYEREKAALDRAASRPGKR